jgi:protein-tyrosine phosphatase
MFDLHSHILHGVDDGSKSLKESVEIARKSVALGFTKMVCTPHYIKGAMDTSVDILEKRLEIVQLALEEESIDLELHLGNELYMDVELLDDLEAGHCNSIAGTSYVLIELPFVSEINHLKDLIYELNIKGYRVVLAHPERYSFVQKDINQLEELVNQGVLLQMNLSSLIGMYGDTVMKTAELMLEKHMVHFIGTDVHGPKTKHLKVEAALEKLSKKLSSDMYQQITHANAERLLKDELIEPYPINTRKKRKWPKRLLLATLTLLIIAVSLIYFGYKKVESQFEAAMIEQAKQFKAQEEAAELEAKKVADEKALAEKEARDALREAEKLEREKLQEIQDNRLDELKKLTEDRLLREEEEALKRAEEAKNEADRLAAEKEAEEARQKLEAERAAAEAEKARLEAERLAEEKRLEEEAAAEEARIEAERLAAEKAAEEEKKRLEAEMEAKYTDYDTDKAKAMDLALSKLSVDQVNQLIQMAAGGFNPEEKQIAKDMFYSNFTPDEQAWILEMYAKYYGS